MRVIRAIAAVAAFLAVVTIPAAARADIIVPPRFYADSGDACVYGFTEGTLGWRFPGPVAVDVSGSVVDKPRLAEPTFCRDDGFYTIATFTAYSGRVVVDSRAAKADNGENGFHFTLGSTSTDTATRLTHLVVQVCRDPVRTLPPSYCGRAVTYYPGIF